jgi:hypothetical protein
MTTLALTAHTAKAAAPAFNADFYIAVVTVIPVLYIALAVQGHSQDILMRAAKRGLRSTRTTDQLTGAFLEVLAGMIVMLGAGAEAIALTALYVGHNIAYSAPLIFWTVIFLVAAVAAGPVIRWVNFDTPEPQRRQTPAPRSEQDGASETEHPTTPESPAAQKIGSGASAAEQLKTPSITEPHTADAGEQA